jgi:hypothetical protein
MLIDDLIVLGRACPEPLKDGRVTVCLAGWSEKHGFIRLYPTRPNFSCSRWDIIKADVERNERDTRAESRKIVGSKNEWETLADKIEVVGHVKKPDQRRNLAGNLCDPSVDFINNQKRSLGIVRPSVIRTYISENPRYDEPFQLGLPAMTEFSQTQVKRDFPFEPRVVYTCPDDPESATKHHQQVLEWGFYRWFFKEPGKEEQVWENAGFGSKNTDIYFLVGNMVRHRNSFMVISVLRFPSGAVTKSMFPLRRWEYD